MLTKSRTNGYRELMKDNYRPWELRRLRGLGTRVRVAEGAELMRAGERGWEAMLVLSGTAACSVSGKEVGSIGPGEFGGGRPPRPRTPDCHCHRLDRPGPARLRPARVRHPGGSIANPCSADACRFGRSPAEGQRSRWLCSQDARRSRAPGPASPPLGWKTAYSIVRR